MGVSAFSCPKEKKSEEGIGYMEVFVALMNKIDSWIWGLPMLVLLCGTHIFMTFRTGFIPVSYTHLEEPGRPELDHPVCRSDC